MCKSKVNLQRLNSGCCHCHTAPEDCQHSRHCQGHFTKVIPSHTWVSPPSEAFFFAFWTLREQLKRKEDTEFLLYAGKHNHWWELHICGFKFLPALSRCCLVFVAVHFLFSCNEKKDLKCFIRLMFVWLLMNVLLAEKQNITSDYSFCCTTLPSQGPTWFW